jgi:hypothetical protein
MTQGVTGTYAFNGAALLLMPETGRWVERELIGIAGNGIPTYPAVREFEFKWSLMSMEEFAQVQQVYETVRASGSVVADLPKYATNPYQFYSYSGCTAKEPTASEFFETYVSGVTFLVLKAR